MSDSRQMRAVGAPVETVDEALAVVLSHVDVPPTEQQRAEIRRALLALAWANYNAGYQRGRAAP